MGSVAGSQVEIEDAAISFTLSILLNQVAVNNAARGRIVQSSVVLLHKESLSDTLVNDHNGDLRLFSDLVVQVRDDTPELGKLLSKDHVTLSIRDSITVDDEVSGLPAFVALLKATNGFADKCTHLVIDDLSALRDKQIVRVVLAKSGVGGCCEANNRLSTRVTHINTD